MRTPLCFTPDSWYLYSRAALASRHDPYFSMCQDCLLWYKDTMVTVERCRFPRTHFVIVDGGIEGRRC